MRPLSHSDGHDPPRLIGECVPRIAAVVDDIVVGFKDAICQPVVAHELPDIFHWVELWRSRRQGQQGDIVREIELVGQMPACLIEEDDGMGVWRDQRSDFVEMRLHRMRVAPGHNQSGAFALLGTDCAKDVG